MNSLIVADCFMGKEKKMVLLARTSIHALLCTFQVAEMYNAQKHNHQNNQDDNDDDD